MDLVYLFRVILKRKWIIIGSAILAAIIAWFLTRNEAKSYRSSARISTGFAVPDEIKVNETNFNMFDAEVRFNNAINTWTSPSVISLLSYELILHDMNSQTPFRRVNPAIKQSPFYKSINSDQARKVFTDKLETMSVLTSYKPEEKDLLEFLNMYSYGFKSLINYFQIYQVPRTDYIQIDCTTENPELSAFIVNNLYKQFIRYYRSIRSSKSQESIDTLQSIMEKKKQDWEEKNKLLRGEGSVNATTENASKLDLIAEFEKALNDEKNKQTDDYYTLRKINQKLGNLGVDIKSPDPGNSNNNEELILARNAMNAAYVDYLKSNADKALLSKYNQLKSEYEAKYSKSNPAIESVPNNKNELLEKKNDVQIDIEASAEKAKALESKINALKANVSSTSSKGANIETLMEEMKLTEKDYFDAKQKYNNALDMGSSAANNFRQLQIAQPAIEPEPSKRKVIVGMAGVVTFLSAILIIVLLTYLDSSIKTPTIFSKTVNLKLISMVNFMNLKNHKLKDIITGPPNEKDQEEHKRNNVFRESIRKLRYEIETTGKKIFLFTSTKKGQGKTTLIQALSYSMSLSKKRILIIDTNFCNNDLTVQLNADPVLEKITTDNGKSFVDKIKFFYKDIGVGSVFVIGSEGGDYTPSEILPRENLLKHLDLLASEFDYIFLEGPPLNDFSDSKELVRYVDGVVAIFSANHIVKQIDKESIAFFKELNGKFCGSVLNMIDLENVNVI
ncbi:GumC family protein [Flavitalea flava]